MPIFQEPEKLQQRVHLHLLKAPVTFVEDQNMTSDAWKETFMIPLADLAVIFVVFQNAEHVTMAKMEQSREIIRMSTVFRFRINQEQGPKKFLRKSHVMTALERDTMIDAGLLMIHSAGLVAIIVENHNVEFALVGLPEQSPTETRIFIALISKIFHLRKQQCGFIR